MVTGYLIGTYHQTIRAIDEIIRPSWIYKPYKVCTLKCYLQVGYPLRSAATIVHQAKSAPLLISSIYKRFWQLRVDRVSLFISNWVKTRYDSKAPNNVGQSRGYYSYTWSMMDQSIYIEVVILPKLGCDGVINLSNREFRRLYSFVRVTV